MSSDGITNDIAPQMNILIIIIAIMMHFCTRLPLKSLFCLKVELGKKQHQQNVT